MTNQSILLLVFCIIVVSYGYPLNCNHGPKYWCLNAKNAEECGVAEFCEIMKVEKNPGIKQTDPEKVIPVAAAAPVNVSLYYESLCPGCRDLIRSQIFPTYLTLKSTGILNIFLYPYGNANEHKSGEKWEFDCQHGEKECKVNLVETCALHLLSPANKLQFIHCIETNPSVQNGEECAKRLGIEWTPIEECYNGPQGNILEHEMAEKTASLKPPHMYVPWITVNGDHTEKIQDKITSNMLKYVCNFYKGPKPAQCNGLVEPKWHRRRVNACYKD